MFGLFKGRKEYKAYESEVDGYLAELFTGLSEYLSAAKLLVNVKKGIRTNFDSQVLAKESAIHLAIILIGTAINHMPQQYRDEALERIKSNDQNSKFNRGINFLTNTAETYTDDDGLLNALQHEIFGTLRGMSRNEIDTWRHESEIQRIVHGR